MACEPYLKKAVTLKRESERGSALIPVIPEPPADPGYLWGYRMYRDSNISSRLHVGSLLGEPRDAVPSTTGTCPHLPLSCLN